MNRISLLDVNVLIALIDVQHEDHEPAHHWFEGSGNVRWATCPLTENGAVRIISGPTYSKDRSFSSPQVLQLLRSFCASRGHAFWPDDVTLRESSLEASRLFRPSLITDIYLLALARSRDGQLVTFDRHIPPEAAEARPEHLHIIKK